MKKSVPCGQSADCLFFELFATLAFKMRLQGKYWGMMEVVKSISVLLVEKPQTLGSEKLLALDAARFSSGDTQTVFPCLADYLSVGCLVSPRTSPENSRCSLRSTACLRNWCPRVKKGALSFWDPVCNSAVCRSERNKEKRFVADSTSCGGVGGNHRKIIQRQWNLGF